MKVWIDTKCKEVGVNANELTDNLAEIDQWIKALRVAREWLRKELEKDHK